MNKFIYTLLTLVSSSLLVSAQSLASYQTTVKNQGPNYYFTFDGGTLTNTTAAHSLTLSSAPNPFNQFGYDVFYDPSNTVYFSASSDGLVDTSASSDQIINSGGGGVASTNSTATGSISFLFKSLDPGIYTAQKYVFSAGYTASNHNTLALLFQNTNSTLGADTNDLELRFGDNTTDVMPFSKIVPDTWYYFAFTYTEATNGYFYDSTGTNLVTIKGKWYLGQAGGTLASGVTTNAIDAVAGEGTFYIGNRSLLNAAFRSPGTGQVDEFATWTRRLSDSEVQSQFTNLPNVVPPPRSQYESLVSGQSPSYFFKMDGSYVDSVSGTLALQTNLGPSSSLGFTYDYFGGPTNAVNFTVGGDALTNNGNLLNGGGTYTGNPGTGKGSITLLFRTLNSYVNQGNRHIYQAGGSSVSSNRFELFFNTFSSVAEPNALKIGFGDSSTTILTTNNFVPATWYYFAMTYDETQITGQVNWWLGQLNGPNPALTSGTLSAVIGSLAGQGNVFVVGSSTNLTSNSFRNSTPPGDGRIQDFAIWHTLLAGSDITNQFNALFASTAPAPTLSLVASGGNAIISWSSSTDPGYGLQSTTNLASATWNSAGMPSTVGGQFVVTNALNPKTQFYRLKK